MSDRAGGSNLIMSADLERAERLLSQTYQIAVGADAHQRLAYRAKIDPMAMGNFITHHKDTLFRKYLPDIDPRHEAAIMTMMVHMLCTGSVARSVSQGKS